MELTTNQKLAIDTRDANILVSAAAGSGKTSVLVERIISRITDTKDPVDVDRLLIMTFTNAAANEMRNRIRDAIDDRIEELQNDPDADREVLERLEKQSMLVHGAMITTIHGFCKSVITDNYEKLSLDPSFRVGDETECKLIRQDALEECLENLYENATPGFLKASECFSSARSDSGFAELIIPVYEFVTADPDPEAFIRQCCKNYEFDSFDDFCSSDLMKRFCDYLTRKVQSMSQIMEYAAHIIDDHEILEPYRPCINAFKTVFSLILSRITAREDLAYNIIRDELSRFEAPSFGRIKGKPDEEEAEAKEIVGSYRDEAKSGVAKLRETVCYDLMTAYGHITATKEELSGLVETVLAFSAVYEEKKRAVSVIDFNDMEHMAVRILKDAETAGAYREQYVEIYVDEYQDSNMTQEMLVSLICRHDPGNVFQVGDVKQSIYRFRHARPDLFLGKYNTYTDGQGANRRILLNDNFRSRREVTDSVNEVFSAIMRAETGGIEYDDAARLNFAATYYEADAPCENDSYRTEIIIGERESLTTEEINANIIADRIQSMIRSRFLVYDKDAKVTRPITFGDITILVRTIKPFEPVFREVFTAAGIPLSVQGYEGYFGTVEIRTALSFLSAVDNPLCDIPLATLAKCPVGGFSDADIAKLTVKAPDGKCLYDRMSAVAAGQEDRTLADKCKNLIGLLEHYKVMSTYTPVYGILSDFIDRLYADHVKCMNKGRQRMANLSMLLNKAEEFGKTSFSGLYQFVRYMDLIRKYEIDDGEAGLVGEKDDAVKLMTMHKSKGLEYPVCFIAGMEKGRNRNDENSRFIRSTVSGFGTDHTDLDRRIRVATIPKMIVREDNRVDSVAEEIRVLYVAMTRAREKLIMVGCDKTGIFDYFTNVRLNPENAGSFLDMIKTAYAPDGFEHIDIKYTNEKEITVDRVGEELERVFTAEELISYGQEKTKEDLPGYILDLPFTYPYPTDPDIRAKLSVSELKHRAIEEMLENGEDVVEKGEKLFAETQPDKYIPRFMRSEGTTRTGGTFYGTSFHRIMELWDYNNDCYITPEMVMEYAGTMHDQHRMDKEMIDAIRPDDVAYFLNSGLGKKMGDAKRAGRLFREQPFVIGIPQSNETVLVQGIIDAYFTGDDGITVVDYKTDHVSDPAILINRYRSQLEYYGKALSQITGQPVAALIIYSTCLKQEITIE